ncbi:unnamed protein product, partial [Allacma fusca]
LNTTGDLSPNPKSQFPVTPAKPMKNSQTGES